MLIDNLNLLTEKYPETLKLIKSMEEELKKDTNAIVEQTRSGVSTLHIINKDGKPLYIHSKYNPIAEAEKFVAQFKDKDLSKYKHVFFYGVGLGYHIEEFAQKYPHLRLIIYEPCPAIMYRFLCHRLLNNVPIKRIRNIYVDNSANTALLLKDIVDFLSDEVLFVCLPSYKRVFAENYNMFVEKFKKMLKDKRTFLRTSYAYEKKWTINSFLNLTKTQSTPNIILEKRKFFSGKPALLVSAGPSLEDELENLRYIKENKLAYIFSVGSAINTLIEYGVFPDAVCAHDPNEWVVNVFSKLIRQKISSIPLIYGTSVGYTLTKLYSGPLLHMIINKDTVSSFFLRPKNKGALDIIDDATTVAIITLQLLFKLGCNPIILVGQNLAYKNNRYYASGINYSNFISEIEEKDIKKEGMVENVYGELVYASDSLRRMRKNMELYVNRFNKSVEILNTTKGGAKVEGTVFIPLEEVIKEKLRTPITIDNWCQEENSSFYDSEHVIKQKELMDKEKQKIEKMIFNIEDSFVKMEKLITQGNRNQLNKTILSFDKNLKQMLKNHFYLVFLKPMQRVKLELIAKVINKIRFENDAILKARRIIDEFTPFIKGCKDDIQLIQKLETKVWEEEDDDSAQLLDYSDGLEIIKTNHSSRLPI